MAAGRAERAGRLLASGSQVGCDEPAGAAGAAAGRQVSGCLPPVQFSQGRDPGSVNSCCWEFTCLQVGGRRGAESERRGSSSKGPVHQLPCLLMASSLGSLQALLRCSRRRDDARGGSHSNAAGGKSTAALDWLGTF